MYFNKKEKSFVLPLQSGCEKLRKLPVIGPPQCTLLDVQNRGGTISTRVPGHAGSIKIQYTQIFPLATSVPTNATTLR